MSSAAVRRLGDVGMMTYCPARRSTVEMLRPGDGRTRSIHASVERDGGMSRLG